MDPRVVLYPVEQRKIPALRELETQFQNRPFHGLVSETTAPPQLANQAPYQRFPNRADPSRSMTISQRSSGYISAMSALKFTCFCN